MQYVKEYVGKTWLEFIEIGSYDEEELSESGVRPDKNISIELDALPCLRFFPYIENLILRPGEIRKEELTYLHGLRVRTLKLDYYSEKIDLYTIDLALFPCLQFVFSRAQYNFKNIAACSSLCTLAVGEWYGDDLQYLLNGRFHALEILHGNLKTLDGIGTIHGLCSVSIANQRALTDIQDLAICRELESLAFEKCGRLDLSRLPALPALRYLKLDGSQKTEGLSFLAGFPKLEYLLLLGLNILDGNLDALRRLHHCAVIPWCRHYSIPHEDLPWSQQKFHSDVIPQEFEILPEAFAGR